MRSVFAAAIVTGGMVLGASGCIVVRSPEAEQPASPATATQEAEPATPTTIAEVIAVCREVEKSRNIPVSCQVKDMNDGVSMIMTFTNTQSSAAYVEPMIQFVGGPFCGIANSASRPAFLYFVVANDYKKYSCEQQNFVGESRPATSTPTTATATRPRTFEDAIRNCHKIQTSNAPVRCDMEYVQGKPALMLVFDNAQDARRYAQPMDDYVTTPFCDSATQQRVSAYIFMAVGQSARPYDCRTKQWGEWFSLEGAAPAAPSANRVPTY